MLVGAIESMMSEILKHFLPACSMSLALARQLSKEGTYKENTEMVRQAIPITEMLEIFNTLLKIKSRVCPQLCVDV